MPDKYIAKTGGCRDGAGVEKPVGFWPYIVLCTVLPVLGTVAFLSNPDNRDHLADTDCYARLLRVRSLCSSGDWYDPVDMRSNAPYGQTSHWTRPFDVVLILGAAALSPVMGFDRALYAWAIVISPLLFIISAVVIRWASRPLLDAGSAVAAGFLFLLQFTLWICFQPARPDHHAFLILLFVIEVGLFIRVIVWPLRPRMCYAAGAVTALAMWVSVESMLPLAAALGTLGLLWVLKERDYLAKAAHYTGALAVCTAISLLCERAPVTLLHVEYDRISIVHLAMFTFIAAFCLTFNRLDRRRVVFAGRQSRLGSLLIGLSLLALFLYAVFPKFYRGPYADLDPTVAHLWLDNVAEMQPLLSGSRFITESVQILLSAALCAPFIIYVLVVGQDRRRAGWLFVGITALTFVLAASLQYFRWSYYAQAILVIPLAGLLGLIVEYGKGRWRRTALIAKNVLARLLFTVGLLCIAIAADMVFGAAAHGHPKAPVKEMCDWLNHSQQWSGRRLRILTHIDIGEEILYRTPYEVIGTSVTIRGRGIADTLAMMSAASDADALRQIRKRGITTILIALDLDETLMRGKVAPKATFSGRLRNGIIPDWLRPVPLPAKLATSFLMFEVRDAAG